MASTNEPRTNTSGRAARLDDILKANGEQHLFDEIQRLSCRVEDAPPVIFGWQDAHVEAFLRAMETAAQAPLPQNPLGLPASVTMRQFNEAVLEYAWSQGAPGRLGTSCLPCSLTEFGQVIFMLASLDLDPWTRRVLALGEPKARPIACVFVPRRPRGNVVTLDRATPHFPGRLWG